MLSKLNNCKTKPLPQASPQWTIVSNDVKAEAMAIHSSQGDGNHCSGCCFVRTKWKDLILVYNFILSKYTQVYYCREILKEKLSKILWVGNWSLGRCHQIQKTIGSEQITFLTPKPQPPSAIWGDPLSQFAWTWRISQGMKICVKTVKLAGKLG